MTIKSYTTDIEVKSNHMGFLNITRKENSPELDNNSAWIEISNDENYPLILESIEDIDELCRVLQESKKLFNL